MGSFKSSTLYVLILFRDSSFMLSPVDNFDKKNFSKDAEFFSCFENTTIENLSEFFAGGSKENKNFIKLILN